MNTQKQKEIQKIRNYLYMIEKRPLSNFEFIDLYNIIYSLCTENDEKEFKIGGKDAYDAIIAFFREYVCFLSPFATVNNSTTIIHDLKCTCYDNLNENQLQSYLENNRNDRSNVYEIQTKNQEKNQNENNNISNKSNLNIPRKTSYLTKSFLYCQIIAFNRILRTINSACQYLNRYYIKHNQMDSFNTIFYSLIFSKFISQIDQQYFLYWNGNNFINDLKIWSDNQYCKDVEISYSNLNNNQESYDMKIPKFDNPILSFYYNCLKYSDNLSHYKKLLIMILDQFKMNNFSMFLNRIENFFSVCEVGKSLLTIEIQSYFQDKKASVIHECIYNILKKGYFFQEIIESFSISEQVIKGIIHLIMRNKKISSINDKTEVVDENTDSSKEIHANFARSHHESLDKKFIDALDKKKIEKSNTDQIFAFNEYKEHLILATIPNDNSNITDMTKKFFILTLINDYFFKNDEMREFINKDLKKRIDLEENDFSPWIVNFIENIYKKLIIFQNDDSLKEQNVQSQTNQSTENYNLEHISLLISYYLYNFPTSTQFLILQSMYKRLLLKQSTLSFEKTISSIFHQNINYYGYSMGWYDYMNDYGEYRLTNQNFKQHESDSPNTFNSCPFPIRVFSEMFCPLEDEKIQLNYRIEKEIKKIQDKIKTNHKLTIINLLSVIEIQIDEIKIIGSIYECTILLNIIDGYSDLINLNEEMLSQIIESQKYNRTKQTNHQIKSIQKMMKIGLIKIEDMKLCFNKSIQDNSTKIYNIYEPKIIFKNEIETHNTEVYQNDMNQILKCKIIKIMKREKKIEMQELFNKTKEIMQNREFIDYYEDVLFHLIENGYLERENNFLKYIT